jgi:hypothetical protein
MSDLKKIEQSFRSRVKLLPWSQFVGAWLASLGLLIAAHAGQGFWFGVGHIGAIIGVLIGLIAFVFSVARTPLVSLRHFLSIAGLILAAGGAVFLSFHPVFWSYLAFIGLGVSQAGQWYDELYP